MFQPNLDTQEMNVCELLQCTLELPASLWIQISDFYVLNLGFQG